MTGVLRKTMARVAGGWKAPSTPTTGIRSVTDDGAAEPRQCGAASTAYLAITR